MYHSVLKEEILNFTDIKNFTLWVPAFINSLDFGVVTVQDGKEVTIPLLR
jgi:hypothetical protein